MSFAAACAEGPRTRLSLSLSSQHFVSLSDRFLSHDSLRADRRPLSMSIRLP